MFLMLKKLIRRSVFIFPEFSLIFVKNTLIVANKESYIQMKLNSSNRVDHPARGVRDPIN